jgi:hypothetical protein
VDVGEDNRSAKINSRKLYLLAVDDIFAATGVKLEVKLDRGIDEITFEDLLHITGDVKTFALSVITYISMKSGSVRLIIEIKMEDAKELTRRFRAGRLQTLGGISIAALDESVNGFPAAGASDESFPVMLDLKQPLTDTDRQNLAEFFEREKERARQAESWLNLALSSILNWLGNYRWHHRLSIWGRITLAARLPRCADWMMTLHGLLFVVIFAIAFDRGATPLPHPCRAAIIWLEHRMDFLPSTWRSVGAAVALWGVVGLLIGCAFKLANRRKLPG